VTVTELSETLGINRATIYRYEAAEIGRIKTITVNAIAEYLKINPDYLTGVSDNKHTVKDAEDIVVRCENSSTLKDRIKEIRKRKGLTLLEVAEYLGVQEATVQRYESGNIKNLKIETISSLADLFGCAPQYLVGWTDNDHEVDAVAMSDEEKMLIELFRRVPVESQQMVLDMVRIALKRDQ
jgi:transcriptional regulator with XRE-family HTH domain